MNEKIGNVVLDMTKYPGQDYYCDGSIEDELLEIAKNIPESEYDRVIKERKKWPLLYHLSPLRENIVDWLPIRKTDKVLEVGSGCGAITGAFARMAGEVTCVDLSKKRSIVNAYRHQNCDNITIHVGNFKDIEPDLPCDYDYICLIGVFEYGQGYIGGESPYEDFLEILKRHLAPGGRMVIAIENKYGLKYFAGCKEDHLGTYFAGIENYAQGGGVRTFGKKGLERIFASCGVTDIHFYYPYPDYKFMTCLYSDRALPGKGELSNNIRNFDRDRMLLFDEKNAYDGILEEELFPVFSNSYLVVLGERPRTDYIKYSNDRAEKFAIKTEILTNDAGQKEVRKIPASIEAVDHVAGLSESYHKLEERFRGGKLSVNRCTLAEDRSVQERSNGRKYAVLDYVKGVPLSELMDRCLERKDINGFYELFGEYLERICFREEVPVTDYDLIFSNILVSGEEWTLIDYEWTCDKAIPAKELAYRAVYCYLLENKKRKAVDIDRVRGMLHMTMEEAAECESRELAFQRAIEGEHRSMALLREDIGCKIIDPLPYLEKIKELSDGNRVQVYEDTGEGYREETSYFVPDAYRREDEIDFTIPVSGKIKNLRIDPALYSCLVKVTGLYWNGESICPGKRKLFVVNGRQIPLHGKEAAEFLFPTQDPNLNIRIEKVFGKKVLSENQLRITMEVTRISEDIASDLAGGRAK